MPNLDYLDKIPATIKTVKAAFKQNDPSSQKRAIQLLVTTLNNLTNLAFDTASRISDSNKPLCSKTFAENAKILLAHGEIEQCYADCIAKYLKTKEWLLHAQKHYQNSIYYLHRIWKNLRNRNDQDDLLKENVLDLLRNSLEGLCDVAYLREDISLLEESALQLLPLGKKEPTSPKHTEIAHQYRLKIAKAKGKNREAQAIEQLLKNLKLT